MRISSLIPLAAFSFCLSFPQFNVILPVLGASVVRVPAVAPEGPDRGSGCRSGPARAHHGGLLGLRGPSGETHHPPLGTLFSWQPPGRWAGQRMASLSPAGSAGGRSGVDESEWGPTPSQLSGAWPRAVEPGCPPCPVLGPWFPGAGTPRARRQAPLPGGGCVGPLCCPTNRSTAGSGPSSLPERGPCAAPRAAVRGSRTALRPGAPEAVRSPRSLVSVPWGPWAEGRCRRPRTGPRGFCSQAAGASLMPHLLQGPLSRSGTQRLHTGAGLCGALRILRWGRRGQRREESRDRPAPRKTRKTRKTQRRGVRPL